MVKRTNTPTHLNKTLEQKCSGVLFLRREAEPLPSCMEFKAACFCLQVLRRLIKKNLRRLGNKLEADVVTLCRKKDWRKKCL